MDRILMYSGGLDSYILKKTNRFEDKECLFVDIGTDENKREWKFIQQHFPEIKRVKLPIANFELQNRIIPFRNNFLTLVGAQFAREIYFGFTAGDTTKDKDWVFKAQMEGQLNYFGTDDHKISINLDGQGYEVKMPVKRMTKAEMVEMYLRSGFDFAGLFEQSISCYEGQEKACGKCRSCLRKYVACKLHADKDQIKHMRTFYYKNNPQKHLESFLQQSIEKGRGEEIENIRRCL